MDGGWRQQWIAMHFGDELQINDLGYLSQNDLNYGHWAVSRRFTGLPEESRYASKDWRWRIRRITHDHGPPLPDHLLIRRRRHPRTETGRGSCSASGVRDVYYT